jgi:opacity protein-like surface antigen
MKLTRAAIATLLFIMLGAAPAYADLTGFLGANMTPANRLVKGVAAGAGLLLIGVEFEYANTADDAKTVAPELRTGMGNVLLQTPFAIFGLQPYVTTGAGFYRERLAAIQHSGFGFNTGGGVKISLVGPLRLRVDYRVFKLGNGALHSPAHRIYAGLNLKF